MAQVSKMFHQKQDLFNSLFTAESNNTMEDNNIVQSKIEKQERVFELSESMLQATVEKLRAGYKRIEDAKSQRRIQVLKVNNCKSHSTGYGYYKNHGKSSQERIEWKLRQLKLQTWILPAARGSGCDHICKGCTSSKWFIHVFKKSKLRPVDWDKLEAQVKKGEEKLEGDAALNKLFSDIYKEADDDMKRASKKSFLESNGTVLSTNWKEVGAKKVETSPPTGMELKKWES